MNKFNLPQGLLDSVTNVLKTNPRDNTPLQEKLIKANQSAVKSATNFDNAVASVVAEGRKKEAERQAKFAESAAKAHKGMGKSIVESITTKEEVIKEELIIAESAFDEIAARMKNIGNARRMQNMTEQKETIAQMTRTFSASFDQIVEANIAEMSQDVILALAEAKAEIRTQMLHAVNVASAARVVDESAKIMAFIAVQEALKGKQKKIDANKNGMIDANDFEVLKKRHARTGSDAVDESAEQVEEGWDDMLKDVKSKMGTQPNGSSGVKKGKRYGGAAQKNDSGEEKEEKPKTNEEVEQIDELSIDGMNKYRKAAKADADAALNKTDPFTSTSAEKKTAMDHMTKRMRGVAKAGRKIMLKGGTPSGVKEEVTNEGVMAKVKSFVKKGLEKVGGGSDEDQLNRLRSNMGMDVEKFKKNTAMDVGGLKKRLAKEEVEQVEEVKNMDTPGNSYKHQCAIHVKHSKLGEGKTLYSQHAQPDADGHIAWYDVMFAEGIERVQTTDIEILESEMHGNHKKK